jgi:hypothetical protein
MIKHALILTSSLMLIPSLTVAQQQFDSLGSPTPAPNQSASPSAAATNVPIPADKSATAGKPATDGSGSTTGSSAASKLPSGTPNPDPTGINRTTPGGLTPD